MRVIMGGHHLLGTKNQENIDRLTALCLALPSERITEKLSNYWKKRTRRLLKTNLCFRRWARETKKKKKPIGTDVNVTGEDGEPPLYLAAQENQVCEYRTNSSARAVDKDTLLIMWYRAKKKLDESHNEREIIERSHCIWPWAWTTNLISWNCCYC